MTEKVSFQDALMRELHPTHLANVSRITMLLLYVEPVCTYFFEFGPAHLTSYFLLRRVGVVVSLQVREVLRSI